MRNEIVKLRTGLEEDMRTIQIAEETALDVEHIICGLYKLAAWFAEHGEYGVIRCSEETVNRMCGIHGMAEAMMSVGWLQRHGEKLRLSGFTNVGSLRKSLGKKLRAQLLAGGLCKLCGTVDNLVIDHIVPICRGGSSRPENLQVLCAPCNRMKGRRLMEELCRAE